MANRLSRRTVAVLILVPLVTASVLYLFILEPNNLRITNMTLCFEDLPADADGLTIAHITDLHLNRIGRRERRVLAALSSRSPDIIAITGDMVSRIKHAEECLDYMSQFEAVIGIWAVQGNWEHYAGWTGDALRRDLSEIGISLLIDEGQAVDVGDSSIWIAGTDDPSLGKDDVRRALEGSGESFIMLLGHSPDVMNRAPGKVRLILSGHTHGGQVKIPFIGAPWAKRMGGGFLSGLYTRNQTVLYVSNGVGMSHIPARFICRPEIEFFTLRSGNRPR